MPTKKRRQVSKTPTPPGAVGTTKPKDHDKEKITPSDANRKDPLNIK